MPCGVNLKRKYAENDELWMVSGLSQIQDSNFNVFTPSELLEAVNAGVTWDDIKSGVASRIDPRRTRGTTAWRDGVYRYNLQGVVDEVMEWINKKELIINENNEWLDIICPWASDHTDGPNLAGYKPLGYGDTPDRRGFHCFHDHCKDHRTTDFLSWVSKNGGPTVPVNDPVPTLVSRWALDMINNDFIDLQAPYPLRIPHTGFKAGHQEDVFWTGADGKGAKATQYGLIVKSSGLLKLSGSKYIPGGPCIIDKGYKKQLNDWHIPDWAIQKISNTNKNWTIFTNFIKYLMPA